MKKLRIIIIALFSTMLFSSCHYLNVVPDDVATIDYAFRLRNQAEKYLFTCYSYLPRFGGMAHNPGLLSGDEVWFIYPNANMQFPPPENWGIARGNQNTIDPYLNYWDGDKGATPLFQGIRDCNTFLANIERVPDMTDFEKNQWIAEVTFLKAFYHWYLLRMYGPIPIIDKNLPVSSSPEEVKVHRQPVDSCFHYIIGLIDSSLNDLPLIINKKTTNLGRITKPIALSIKARILVTWASPLFNGNTDYSNFVDNKGRHLFNTTYNSALWDSAAKACKEAIETCQIVGNKLYYFNPAVQPYPLGDEIQHQMNCRNAIADKWNSGLIWGATNNPGGVQAIQQRAQAYLIPGGTHNYGAIPLSYYAPTLRVAEMFYTDKGLPIDEDKTWDYDRRYELDTATNANKYRIKPGYVTAYLNFNRGARFYADLGFDGGYWYGNGEGKYDQEDMYHIEGRSGGYSHFGDNYTITGYLAKKLVNYENTVDAEGAYTYEWYPWPIMRLADLYLLYSEALNESMDKPDKEVYHWIDLVRERAGLPTVEQSWSTYSKHPDKYKTKEGFREIIHSEELIELAFEGGRYWDLRRWKKLQKKMNQPIKGWDVNQKDPAYYYKTTTLFTPSFTKKDYFWPLKEHDIVINKNLIQNIGW